MADRAIKPDSGNQLVLQDEGGSAALTVETDGDIKINAGNIIIGTSGKGVNFSGKSRTGVFDDYETGTWNAVYNGASSYGNQTGFYVKIGSMVYISWYSGSFTTTAVSATITGLPFAPITTSYEAWLAYAAHGTSVNSRTGYIESSNSTIYMIDSNSTSTSTSNAGSGKYIMITAMYRTAS
jgi:hypothetical protein